MRFFTLITFVFLFFILLKAFRFFIKISKINNKSQQNFSSSKERKNFDNVIDVDYEEIKKEDSNKN